MTDGDNSYRPRSPDFSGFQPSPHSSYNYPPPPPPPAPQQEQQQQQQQQPPQTYADAYHAPYVPPSLTPQASYDASPFFNPPPAAARQQYVPPQLQPPPQQLLLQQQQQQPSEPPPLHPYNSIYGHGQPEMPPQTRSSTRSSAGRHAQPQPQPPQQPPQQQTAHHSYYYHPHQPYLSLHTPHQPQQQQELTPQPGPAPSGSASNEPATAVAQAGPGPSQGIDIKTKFPVARIKRIMQADEDVGKVAQVTPIAVAKALELFMINLVTKAADQAKDRSSKRITAAHLKEAVQKDEVLDFLADIMSKVPDQAASKGKQEEDGSDHNTDGRRRRGAGAAAGGGGRRKKEEDLDDGF